MYLFNGSGYNPLHFCRSSILKSPFTDPGTNLAVHLNMDLT